MYLKCYIISFAEYSYTYIQLVIYLICKELLNKRLEVNSVKCSCARENLFQYFWTITNLLLQT